MTDFATIGRRFVGTAPLSRHALASMRVGDRAYLALAEFYAAAGRVDDARRLLTDYVAVSAV